LNSVSFSPGLRNFSLREINEDESEILMTDEGTGKLPTAVTKAYDLLLWLINHVGKFPGPHFPSLPFRACRI
jgi:hypothetical protein